jgi:phasin family protein
MQQCCDAAVHEHPQEISMIVDMQEFVTERGEVLVGQVRKMRETSVETVREAVVGSAETLKALKSPVRMIARSGIKLTTVSQTTVQNLIELQSDVVTSALNDVALRLERATRAENIVEFVREQIELTPASRARMIEDANRAVTILKTAGRDIRNVARHAYESIVEKAEKEAEAPKAAVRRKTATAKRATRKTVRRVRKAA